MENDSDINWRNINEDDSLWYFGNKGRAILIYTNIGAIRESNTRYIDSNRECRACKEKVERYAFI